jgi:hypothetical protein
MTRRTRQAGSAPRRRSLLVSSDDDDAGDEAAAAEKPKPQEESPPPLAVTTRARRSAEQAEQRTRRVSGEAAARAEALARLREAREAGGSRPTRQPAQRASRGAAAAAHDSDAFHDEEEESEESEEAAGTEGGSRSWSPARRSWQQLKSHLHKPEHKKRKFYEYRGKPVAGLKMERMSDDEAAASDMDDFIADDEDEDGEEEKEEESGGGEEAAGDSEGAVGTASDSDGPVVAPRGTASARGAKRRSRLVESSDDKEEEDDDDVPVARGKKVAAPRQPPSGSEKSSSEDDDAPPKAKQRAAVRRRKAVVTSSDDDAAAEAALKQKRKTGKLRRVSGAAPEASPPQEWSPRTTPRKKKTASQTAVQDALARLVAVQGTQAATGSQRLAEQLRATGALGDDEEEDEKEEGDGDGAQRAAARSSDEDDSGGSGFIVYDDDDDRDAAGGAEAETDGRVACVCGATREDGDGLGGRTLVQCSNGTCRVWMHADCVGYAPKDAAAASAAWFCRRCEPAAKALLAESTQLPSTGFQPVGAIHEDLPPSEAARRAWQAVHGTREVGAALASVLGTDSAAALVALLDWSRPGAVSLALRRSGNKSILYRAAECGATRCCRALLRRPGGVLPSTAPAQALCAALQAGKPATVRALVQECPGIMALARKSGTYDAGGTAVHAAAAGGSNECIGMSLSGLGDVACREALTAVDEELCTPLMLAAGSADHSALLHIINLLGTTYAADEAKRTDHNGQNAAHYAASAGVVQSIAALSVLHPPLLLARDSTGTAPLHLAAAEGHVAAVHELVRRGASVAAPDNAGWTPLLYANGDAALALLEHQPEAQLDALQVHLTESTTAEHRAMRLMRTLSESPGCFAVLNSYLRDRIYLLANRLSFFLRRPAVLDVVNKRKWLHYCVSQQRIAAAHSSMGEEPSEADLLWATRDHPFTDSIQWLLAQRPQRLLLPIYPILRFVESPNSFGAGIEREWLTLIAKQLATSSTRMLAPTTDGGRSLAPISGALTATQQENMHALGLLFAYCLVHERTLPVPLEAPFLRCLLGRASTLSVDDLEAVDPACWRSFRVLLEQTNVDAMGLTWELDGCELTPGGSNLAVTDTNKAAFVAAAASWKLHGRISSAVSAIRGGLNSVLSRDTLAVLTDGDLGLLLGGVTTIDLEDWKAHTEYEGFSSGDDQIRCVLYCLSRHSYGWTPRADNLPAPHRWFWQCVTAMSPEERGLLLKLATGASAPPAGGFKELQGMGGPQAFTIQKVNAPAHHLPTASTCFNLLKMPGGYASYKDLERKLLAAVRFGSSGFEFV